MKVYVLRHGETDYNVEYRISGQVPAMLTEKGKKQAYEAGQIIKDLPIEHIYVSPLQRAIDTANIVNVNHIEMSIEPRIIEVSFGIFEGMSRDTQAFKDVKYHLGMRYPEGETFLEVIHRVYSFLDELKESNYECVLLVCHGAVLRAIYSRFNDMTNDDFYNFRTRNCQLELFEL